MGPGGSQESLASYLALPLVAAIPAAVAMWMLWDIGFLDTDAAQYLSVARSILDGAGVSSSIVFYEQQLAFGVMPAPQTVFPPGMSLLLAAFLKAGLDPPTAILVAGILEYGVIGVVLAVVLRRQGVGRFLVFLATSLWLFQGTAWANVMQGRSEIAFTLATLLSTAVLLAAEGRRSRFVLAGALAAAAVLIRYQGLFFVAALGAWSAWSWLRTPTGLRRRFALDAALLLLLPLAAVGSLLIRNLLLAGAPGGGPVDSVYWNAADGIGIAYSAYWALEPFLGLSVDGLAQFQWREIAAVVGVLLLGGWIVRNAPALASGPARQNGPDARVALWRLVISYVFVTCLALAILATRSTGYMQGRFLVPLVPFVAAVWIIALDRMLGMTNARGRAVLFAALLSLHAGLFAGQARVLRDWLDTLRADQRASALTSALAEDMKGSTLGQFLRENITNDAPLLATGGQLLWLLTELPVVETTPAGFSSRSWDESELWQLNRCLGVRFLLYIPGVFDPQRPENRNQPLYLSLARGGEPASLRPLLRTPQVRLYEFEPMAEPGAQVAQDHVNDECN